MMNRKMVNLRLYNNVCENINTVGNSDNLSVTKESSE